jgi:hypothetical protein
MASGLDVRISRCDSTQCHSASNSASNSPIIGVNLFSLYKTNRSVFIQSNKDNLQHNNNTIHTLY